MNIQDIRTIYGYNDWANRRILMAASQVSLEQFLAPAAHPFGSLRGTLVHMVDSEYGWRVLCQQQGLRQQPIFTDALDEAEFPTVAAVAERWQEEEQALRDYLAQITDTDLTGYVRYTTDEGHKRERLLWHCLLHVVNHGTQHRSEAAAILTGYGCSPGELDFTIFLNEQAS